VPEYPQKN